MNSGMLKICWIVCLKFNSTQCICLDETALEPIGPPATTMDHCIGGYGYELEIDGIDYVTNGIRCTTD